MATCQSWQPARPETRAIRPKAWTSLVAVGMTLSIVWGLFSPPSRAQGPGIPLECRLGRGRWQPCRMEVVDTGRKWFVVVGRRRYGFDHDGTGRMRMSVEGAWREVTPRWERDGSLCWNEVCVRGEIPLD